MAWIELRPAADGVNAFRNDCYFPILVVLVRWLLVDVRADTHFVKFRLA